MTAPSSRCPECGAERAGPSSMAGLCAGCLLKAALTIDDDPCPYEILAPLAESARGVTYLAQPLARRGAPVAFKIFGASMDATAVLTRFEAMKDRLSGFQHPGAARLVDVGTDDDGRLFMATEYVAGWPLSAIDLRRSAGADQRAEIARQLSDALGAAHAAGIGHSALDASKIKVTSVGRVHAVVIGFGLASILDGAPDDFGGDRVALARILGALHVTL